MWDIIFFLIDITQLHKCYEKIKKYDGDANGFHDKPNN